MKDELISILESSGYPVMLQGSLGTNKKYPDSFFTFWNNETSDGAHYDNFALNTIWDFTIYFYSTDPTTVNTVLEATKKKLQKTGWIVGGKGYDVASDEKTHTGRAVDVFFVEKNTQED